VTGHQKEHHSPLGNGVIFPHDNDQTHTAQQTWNLWQKFSWETLDSSTYSWDVVPTLKKHLSRHCFNCDKAVSHTIITWLTRQKRMFYAPGMENFITGYEKLLTYRGDYVENNVPVTLSLCIACFNY
jgi:hypothetical protein